MKSIFLILCLFAIINGYSQKTKPKTGEVSKTKAISNSYQISSPHGHKFKIEIDYIIRDSKTLSNDCIAQYIITNIGDKDYLREEQFPTEKKNIYGGNITDFDPSLIFEFTTSDGKKIEASQNMDENILVGKSTQAKIVRIQAGARLCLGEIKPVRVQFRSTN